ncbi:hypothetical protein HUU42_16550 [bacterium]|nr:hypothetical protein [bacterium]
MRPLMMALLIYFTVSPLGAQQQSLWVKLERGESLYLDPLAMQWVPISAKQTLPSKTFVLTKERTELKLYKETDVYNTPDHGYFFLEDVVLKSKNDLVGALTQIEGEQLPSMKVDSGGKQSVGLTYGFPGAEKTSVNIPFFEERLNAIRWFYNQKRYDAALLSLKRLLTRFPNQYYSASRLEMLFDLYEKAELYGFIFDETNRLMALQKNDEFGPVIVRWNEVAKKYLLKR